MSDKPKDDPAALCRALAEFLDRSVYRAPETWMAEAAMGVDAIAASLGLVNPLRKELDEARRHIVALAAYGAALGANGDPSDEARQKWDAQIDDVSAFLARDTKPAIVAAFDEWYETTDPEYGGPTIINEAILIDLAARLDRAQWRRVEDGLPEYDTRVLVRLSNDPETQIGARILYNNIWFRIDSYAEHCNESDKVTHWRPMPEEPGE